MNVSIRVVGQELRLTAPFRPLVSGTQNFIKFKFLFFDKDWDELTTFAQIVQGDNAYNLYLDDDDSVILPPEITEGVCTIMLYGSGTTTPDNIDADNTLKLMHDRVSNPELTYGQRLLKLISERGYINTHTMLSMNHKKTSKDFVNNMNIEDCDLYKKYVPIALFNR